MKLDFDLRALGIRDRTTWWSLDESYGWRRLDCVWYAIFVLVAANMVFVHFRLDSLSWAALLSNLALCIFAGSESDRLKRLRKERLDGERLAATLAAMAPRREPV